MALRYAVEAITAGIAPALTIARAVAPERVKNAGEATLERDHRDAFGSAGRDALDPGPERSRVRALRLQHAPRRLDQEAAHPSIPYDIGYQSAE